MSKSILVIDTPKNCYSCPMMYDSYGLDDYCAVKQTIIEDYKIRPEWCPLLSLSKKIYKEKVMDLKTSEKIITINNDGTYNVEIPNVEFMDENGNVIKGKIIIPRLLDNGEPISNCIPLNLEEAVGELFTITIEEE